MFYRLYRTAALGRLALVLCAWCTATQQSGAIAGESGPSDPALSDQPPMAIRLPDSAPDSVRDVQTRIYLAMEKQARYLLSTVHPWDEDQQLLLLTESRSGEHWVRPNSGAVEGFCFLYRFGPYDETQVGRSRADLLKQTILPMMRYLTQTHITGTRPTSDGKPWGNAWQSAHWAQMLGRGAWWVWPELPAELRDRVKRLVLYEADRIANATPPYQLRNDTKAEENAWNSQILSVAMLLMPGDSRFATWQRKYQEWVMSSFLRPADETNDRQVDGRRVRDQFHGANIFDDFTLENHGFVHPDYMTCFNLSLGCAVDFAMTDRHPPEALLFNAGPIYDNLKWMQLPDGGFVYPNGQDWEVFRNPDWLGKHILMAVWARDPDAWAGVMCTLGALERMQSRTDSGAIFHSREYFFASKQHDVFRMLGNSWLNLQVATAIVNRPHDPLGVRRWDSAKIVLHRSPTAIHTVSWGARVMAQCVPLRLDRIVSPYERNGVGYVRTADSPKPLRVELRGATVNDDKSGFDVKLVVDHGKAIRATLRFRSEADGSFVMQEQLVALEEITTGEIATGCIGILNNPFWVYERGKRQITVDGKPFEMTSGSGEVRPCEGAKQIAVDDVLKISAERPLAASYKSAREPERGRITDLLILNHLPGERHWQSGQAISTYEAVIRCEAAP
jgi:hypothetical protein